MRLTRYRSIGMRLIRYGSIGMRLIRYGSMEIIYFSHSTRAPSDRRDSTDVPSSGFVREMIVSYTNIIVSQ